MFKKLTVCTLLLLFISSSFAYTANDVSQANYLASKKIIKDWSSNPVNYRFDDYIARSEIMGMVLAMVGVTRNATCRGDFVDVPKSNIDWVCRTIETAADKWFINAKPIGMKTRPYGNITRAEALGILMKAYPDDGGWAGYGYYWGYNFPVNGQTWGYESAYDFSAMWQASVFYAYIRKILGDTEQLKVNPRPNDKATRREVFDFATKIDKKNTNSSSRVSTSNALLGIEFSHPSDAIVSSPIQRKTTDGHNIIELIVTPAGMDPTTIHFFTSYEWVDIENIQIIDWINIKNSEFFYDVLIDGYKGTRRVDYYLNNTCTNETTVVDKNSVIYGSAITQCPTHPQGYDQLRRDIVDSLSL